MGDKQRYWSLGYWDEPKDFEKACEASHHAGHRGHQAFCPWPIHGIEKKMGLRRSWVGRPVLVTLLFGALAGFLMQYWMMKVDWPIIISGKAYNSWPAYVVITFESGILCGSIANLLICLLVACRLAPRPDVQLPSDRLTDDEFCLAIPTGDPADLEVLERWLTDHGAGRTERFIPPAATAGAPEVAHA